VESFGDITPLLVKGLFDHCAKVMGRPFPPDNYVVLDTETTGFDMINGRVLQIGMCEVKDREETNRSSVLLKIPEHVEINPKAESVHGITRERLEKDGVNPRVYYPELKAVLESYEKAGFPIVGHNFARFDGPFLEAEFIRNGSPYKFGYNNVIDTGMLVKAARLKKLPTKEATLRGLWTEIADLRVFGLYYALDRYCFDAFGLEKHGADKGAAHDAAYDCWMTHLVLEELRQLSYRA
jgi:DNA polymerase III epsilon subunit-like protein